jgi:zinc/manganese transport system substrate-binding protein
VKYLTLLLSITFLSGVMQLHSQSISIVAAENFYGGVASQVAGSSARVTSIMSNPNQDPHEFQTDVNTARAVANADIVIYSGIGYDTWMEKLLASQGKSGRIVIKVSDLIGAKDGDNPHIWYDPKTMPALVTKLAVILNKPDAAANFEDSMKPLLAKVAQLRSKAAGVKVTATEPVFGYMAAALGFEMLNYDYQVAVMNDTEPSFRETAAFEESLKTKTAKVLFYNSQVTDPSTKRMQSIARESGVPVVGVTETEPDKPKGYVPWMLSQLGIIESVLK